MPIKKIIVVFKTHLDIGSADFASEVAPEEDSAAFCFAWHDKPSRYAFYDRLPDTNFPMWNEGDARFRFVMERSRHAPPS